MSSDSEEKIRVHITVTRSGIVSKSVLKNKNTMPDSDCGTSATRASNASNASDRYAQGPNVQSGQVQNASNNDSDNVSFDPGDLRKKLHQRPRCTGRVNKKYYKKCR